MIDPDNIGPLAVRFYQREVQNEFLTQQEGRPISVMRDFVRRDDYHNDIRDIRAMLDKIFNQLNDKADK